MQKELHEEIQEAGGNDNVHIEVSKPSVATSATTSNSQIILEQMPIESGQGGDQEESDDDSSFFACSVQAKRNIPSNQKYLLLFLLFLPCLASFKYSKKK